MLKVSGMPQSRAARVNVSVAVSALTGSGCRSGLLAAVALLAVVLSSAAVPVSLRRGGGGVGACCATVLQPPAEPPSLLRFGPGARGPGAEPHLGSSGTQLRMSSGPFSEQSPSR